MAIVAVMRILLLSLLLLFPALVARAERIIEVQNVKIEQNSSYSRDAAVAAATQKAAAQVWAKLGHTTPAPVFSAAQLQNMSSYVDVTRETAQPNYYAATFNVGIRAAALGGGSVPTLPVFTAPALNVPASVAAVAHNNNSLSTPHALSLPPSATPAWILVVPAREVNGTMQLWLNDEWAQAWQQPHTGRLSFLSANGDARDKTLLTSEQTEGIDATLANHLLDLAGKYRAPAIALVTLSSADKKLADNEEIKIEVSMMTSLEGELQTSQTALFVRSKARDNPWFLATSEAKNLIAALINGTHKADAAPAPAPVVFQKLWVRIPLSKPNDLNNFRAKIESLPQTRFEIITLATDYVEGNIIYTGSQQSLMDKLAAQGLRQQ